MAEADAPKGGTKGLKRRVGPLSLGGWLLSLGGAAVLYLGFRRYEADKAASAAAGGGTGSGVLTAGGTVPTTGLASTTTTGTFTDYASWLQAAVSAIASGGGIDSGQALDGIQTWLGGGCVSQKVYNAVTQEVISNTSIGLPPGWGTSIPSLTVCAAPSPPPKTPSTPTPSTPAAPAPAPNNSNENAPLTAGLIAMMTNNGEHVISSYFDSADNTMYYLTNKGGVYNIGSGFYGSAFSLGNEFVGTPVSITGNKLGGYTIVNNYGQTYNFGPKGTGSDYAGSTSGVGV